ncbi:MAG: PPOX class F420-dependent oxidoreductase [Dehalococcoidia bacterium]
MPIQLTDAHKKLLDAKAFAFLGTINTDGSPQVTPVWIDHDGTHIVVNSEQKRRKVRNIQRDPRVSVSLTNPENPYQYLEFRGRVVEVTPEGGAEGIDRLAKKYLGQDTYPYNQPGDVRVVIRIQPEHVAGQ